MSSAALDKQVIVDLLRSDPHDRRIAVTTQDGFYNEWLTYLFPYHQVEAFNPTQWPRLPTDYRKFLAALRGQDVRLWELAAVGHVMAPTKTWNQISRSAWSTSFEKVSDYDVVLDETERVRVVPPVVDQTGQHCILRLKSAAPKYVLVHDWEIVSNETALRRLQDPSFVPLTKVWISEDTVSELPEPAMSGITPITSAVRESLREVKIRATTERPAILRISERYLPEWSVHIDGVPANLLRCDFLMQGVYLKPGTHVVSLSYQSNIGYRWMQWLVLVLCVAGASTILMRKYRIILGGKPPGGTGTAAKHS